MKHISLRIGGSFHANSATPWKRPSSILMIFGLLVDIYERTSEPKYGPAMTSSYGETEAGKSALTRFSAQNPDLQRVITFFTFIGINIIPTPYNRQERFLKCFSLKKHEQTRLGGYFQLLKT